jgi:hypothetical protein
MRTHLHWLPLLVGWTSSCASPHPAVVAVDPDANFVGRRTFEILQVPKCAVRRWPIDANDPMLLTSPLNATLRAAIERGFESRGYVAVRSNGNFGVAYYASATTDLDVEDWDYGYRWRPVWWTWQAAGDTLTTRYPAGTVILDAIDRFTRTVLWRGRATFSPTSRGSLEQAVDLILGQFPPMRSRPVVVGVDNPAGASPAYCESGSPIR